MRLLTSLYLALVLLSPYSVGLAIAQQAGGAPTTIAARGDDFVAEVLDSLERRSNVSARLRYQAHLRDEIQVGAGSYWQQGIGTQQLTHWEMQTKIAEETAGYVQIFDGRYVWTDRHLPRGREVRRLDVANLENRLRTLQLALHAHEQSKRIESAAFRGGFSQLLAEMLTRYEFSAPRATQLNGFAVQAVIGRWRPDQLTELSPTADAAAPSSSDWPAQIPHHVLLLVGQANLFPYVVEFRRADDAYLIETVAGMKPAHDPLLRYEIFEVRFSDAIDPSVFVFRPGDIEWSDETSVVFDKLQAQRRPAAEIADRRR